MERLHRAWVRLKKGRPGERFAAFHHRSKDRPPKRRWLRLFAAGAILAVGFLLLFIPGPGIVFLVAGAGLLAQEFLSVARALDWLEVAGRRLYQRAFAAWNRRSRAGRLALVLASLIAVAGAALVASRLLLAALKTG